MPETPLHHVHTLLSTAHALLYEANDPSLLPLAREIATTMDAVFATMYPEDNEPRKVGLPCNHPAPRDRVQRDCQSGNSAAEFWADE